MVPYGKSHHSLLDIILPHLTSNSSAIGHAEPPRSVRLSGNIEDHQGQRVRLRCDIFCVVQLQIGRKCHGLQLPIRKAVSRTINLEQKKRRRTYTR